MKPIHLIPLRAVLGSDSIGWSSWRPRWRAPSTRPAASGRRRSISRSRCDERRGQHYSTAILQRLEQVADPNARVLAVTACDLYVPVLTFVFGEAQLEGNCAVVSTARLREEFYGMPPRQDVLRERLVKEAAHELGHTFGLRHCADWSCVMASSHGVERLDVKGAEFCRLVPEADRWRAATGSRGYLTRSSKSMHQHQGVRG